MKTKIALLILMLTIIHICNAQQTKIKKTEAEENGYKGKVKRAIQSHYVAVEKGNEIVKGKKAGSPEENFCFKYNEVGNKIEELTYDKDSTLITKVDCKYDNESNPVEMIGYNSENAVPNLNYKLTWKYDSLGGVLEENNFQSNGSVYYEYKFTNKYDAKGNRIEKNQDFFNGDLHRKFTYVFDENGNKIEEAVYMKNGNLMSKQTYSYDVSRDVVEWNNFNSNGGSLGRVTYKYDSLGNKIEWNEFNSKGNLKNRDVKKFDEKGNTIEEIFYDGKGKLIDTHTWKYDYDQKGNWIKKIEFKDGKPKFITLRQIEYYM